MARAGPPNCAALLLDFFEHFFGIEFSFVQVAVNVDGRRAFHAGVDAHFAIFGDATFIGAGADSFHDALSIEAARFQQRVEIVERFLVFKKEFVDLPEFVLFDGGFGGQRGGDGVRMFVDKGEMTVRVAEAVAQEFGELHDRVVRFSAVRAFVVAVFEQHYLAVRIAVDVVAIRVRQHQVRQCRMLFRFHAATWRRPETNTSPSNCALRVHARAGRFSSFTPMRNQGGSHFARRGHALHFVTMAVKKSEVEAPGEFFDVGGRRLHTLITGTETARRPVVLEAGLTAISSCWAWVQDGASKTTKVLSYDRAGLGWSDPSRDRKDARSIANDLHRLLDVAKFPRPFVFVGHSMGGIFGRAYAALYPDEVSGMALVDASHPEQIERSPNIRKSLRKFFWFLKATPYMASCGVMKVCGDFGMSAQAAGLPEMQTRVAKNFYSSARHMRETVREAEQWYVSAAQVKEKRLGDLPLVAISAPEKCMHGWLDLQKELSEISTRGRHVVIDGASHVTILTNCRYAKRVADEVSALI